jgi:hypothetical protein
VVINRKLRQNLFRKDHTLCLHLTGQNLTKQPSPATRTSEFSTNLDKIKSSFPGYLCLFSVTNNNIPQTREFIKIRFLFWVMVLAQGQRAASGDGFLLAESRGDIEHHMGRDLAKLAFMTESFWG